MKKTHPEQDRCVRTHPLISYVFDDTLKIVFVKVECIFECAYDTKSRY